MSNYVFLREKFNNFKKNITSQPPRRFATDNYLNSCFLENVLPTVFDEENIEMAKKESN